LTCAAGRPRATTAAAVLAHVGHRVVHAAEVVLEDDPVSCNDPGAAALGFGKGDPVAARPPRALGRDVVIRAVCPDGDRRRQPATAGAAGYVERPATVNAGQHAGLRLRGD